MNSGDLQQCCMDYCYGSITIEIYVKRVTKIVFENFEGFSSKAERIRGISKRINVCTLLGTNIYINIHYSWSIITYLNVIYTSLSSEICITNIYYIYPCKMNCNTFVPITYSIIM